MPKHNSINILYSYNSIHIRYFSNLILFLVWPFGVFLNALVNYDKRESKIILILFTAIFGYSMIAESEGLDLYRIMNSLPDYSHIRFSDFVHHLVKSDSNYESESVDLYRDIVTFLVSRFTDNGRWLMLIFGLVAGYVYTKVLSLFMFETPDRNIYTNLIIISFSFIIGIDQLAGVRFSLAAYVFFYGAINVINFRDNRYLVVAALSILIHFSFLTVVLLLVIFIRLKKHPKIIYLLLILSFILPNLLKGYIVQYSGFFGQGIEARTTLYSTLDSDLNLFSDTVWYVKYRISLMLIFCYITLFITRLKKKDLNYSFITSDLFFFALLLLSFVNFTIDIPHLGFRFQFIFLMFTFFYLFKIYIDNSESSLISNLVLISFPFSINMIVYSLRSILVYAPLTLFYYNVPELFIDQPTRSVWMSIFK